MVKKNACVFISGFGSNLKSLIQNSRDPVFPINIKLIISNNVNAAGILHAKKNGRAGFIISSPIILHPLKSDSQEKYVPEVDQALRNGASLINWI